MILAMQNGNADGFIVKVVGQLTMPQRYLDILSLNC
jgi:hypothetical protein